VGRRLCRRQNSYLGADTQQALCSTLGDIAGAASPTHGGRGGSVCSATAGVSRRPRPFRVHPSHSAGTASMAGKGGERTFDGRGAPTECRIGGTAFGTAPSGKPGQSQIFELKSERRSQPWTPPYSGKPAILRPSVRTSSSGPSRYKSYRRNMLIEEYARGNCRSGRLSRNSSNRPRWAGAAA
jgi:hypothetical protein